MPVGRNEYLFLKLLGVHERLFQLWIVPDIVSWSFLNIRVDSAEIIQWFHFIFVEVDCLAEKDFLQIEGKLLESLFYFKFFDFLQMCYVAYHLDNTCFKWIHETPICVFFVLKLHRLVRPVYMVISGRVVLGINFSYSSDP